MKIPGEMMKIIYMLAVIVGMTAGCTPLHPSDCHKTTATGLCSSGRWDDEDEWGVQAREIRAAIYAEIAENKSWGRKRCLLHIEFSQDGKPQKISTSDGDKAFCEAIQSAAWKAKFPAFSSPEVYRDFQKIGRAHV